MPSGQYPRTSPRIIRDLDRRLDELLTNAIPCSNDCLELYERQDIDGYPVLSGFHKGKWKTEKVARWILYREYGEIVFSQEVVTRHLCNNRACVNPHHLTYGTHQDNSADMSKAGRNRAGKSIHQHKRLDKTMQQFVADQYDPIARNGEALAIQYGITRERVRQIVALYAPWKKAQK